MEPNGPAPDSNARETTSLLILKSPVLAAAGVRHGFSTRLGGVSTAYRKPEARGGELNLGFTSADQRENVVRNRARLIQEAFGAHRPLITMRQIHSALVHQVGRRDVAVPTVFEGDGLMTDEPGAVLGIQTADCVPVLVADSARGVVAAFHAGWRGTLQRIVEKSIERLRLEFGCEPGSLVAAIGPAIRPCCYRVGDEVRQGFRSQFNYAEQLFSWHREAGETEEADLGGIAAVEQPAVYLDLQEANRRQLMAAGVQPSVIDVLSLCTSCRTDLFFSYRAEPNGTGRMLAVIARN